jgi:hypothetical protein
MGNIIGELEIHSSESDFCSKTEEMNEQIEPNQTNSHTIASTAAGYCWVSWLCLGFTHQYELISSELVWYEDQLKVGCVGDSDLVLNTLEFVDQETMVSECDLNCRGLLLVVQCFMLMTLAGGLEFHWNCVHWWNMPVWKVEVSLK